MATTCRICVEETKGDSDYHPICLRQLFKAAALPRLDLDLGSLSDMAQKMVGRMSISGVQQKVLVSLSADGSKLGFASPGGRYILKPPINTFPEIPANEHVTMRMAGLVDIDVPPCGLLQLNDGNIAYIVARFDRLEDGSKLQQEDFCQVAGLPPSRKYDQSAESCVRLLRQYASEPLISVLALYRLLLYSWCVGNGDLHLKNLSLLTTQQGIRRLSPAYDLVNTKLVIAEDRLAMPIGGKTSNLKRKDWEAFGAYCEVPPRTVERVLHKQAAALDEMVRMVRRSFLSDPMKKHYEEILRANVGAIVQ